MCKGLCHGHGCRYGRLCSGSRGGVAESARGGHSARSAGIIIIIACLVSVLAPVASAQQAEPPEPPTGDPAIDAWVRPTFGQPVDPETLDDPIWGTRTLLALTPGQREGARLFMQRCNVCHGAAMNSMDAYGPFITRDRVNGREDAVRRVIADGTERMPAFKYGLTGAQIDLIVDYLGPMEGADGRRWSVEEWDRCRNRNCGLVGERC